jgi:hypothetical protein
VSCRPSCSNSWDSSISKLTLYGRHISVFHYKDFKVSRWRHGTNGILQTYMKRYQIIFRLLTLMKQWLPELRGIQWETSCSIWLQFMIQCNIRFPCLMQGAAWDDPAAILSAGDLRLQIWFSSAVCGQVLNLSITTCEQVDLSDRITL